jgi:hypothetical protein
MKTTYKHASWFSLNNKSFRIFSGFDLFSGGHLGAPEEGDGPRGHLRLGGPPVSSAKRTETDSVRKKWCEGKNTQLWL